MRVQLISKQPQKCLLNSAFE